MKVLLKQTKKTQIIDLQLTSRRWPYFTNLYNATQTLGLLGNKTEKLRFHFCRFIRPTTMVLGPPHPTQFQNMLYSCKKATCVN